jgi:hypothetical protein
VRPGCIAVVLGLLWARGAYALPTMVRIGYGGCATCHISPQGGGLLTEYGRGVDDAQSLRAGEYRPQEDERAFLRIHHDVRFLLQERSAVDASGVARPANFFRVLYRNSTHLGRHLRVSGVVGAESPGPTSASADTSPTAVPFVSQALAHFRPAETIEISIGRDQLPSGLNLPDLTAFIKANNQMSFHDYPTQLKAAWWSSRALVMPYLFAPTLHEQGGSAEWGGGALAERDVSGEQTKVIGLNALVARAAAQDRQSVGVFSRLGFGQWGIFAEYDLARRRSREDGQSHLQHTSYLQAFYAIREWLVTSVVGEHLLVDSPATEQRVAGKLEVSMRLAPYVTLVSSLREVYQPATRESAMVATAQLYVKTAE